MFKDGPYNHSGSWLRLHRYILGSLKGAKQLLADKVLFVTVSRYQI